MTKVSKMSILMFGDYIWTCGFYPPNIKKCQKVTIDNWLSHICPTPSTNRCKPAITARSSARYESLSCSMCRAEIESDTQSRITAPRDAWIPHMGIGTPLWSSERDQPSKIAFVSLLLISNSVNLECDLCQHNQFKISSQWKPVRVVCEIMQKHSLLLQRVPSLHPLQLLVRHIQHHAVPAPGVWLRDPDLATATGVPVLHVQTKTLLWRVSCIPLHVVHSVRSSCHAIYVPHGGGLLEGLPVGKGAPLHQLEQNHHAFQRDDGGEGATCWGWKSKLLSGDKKRKNHMVRELSGLSHSSAECKTDTLMHTYFCQLA